VPGSELTIVPGQGHMVHHFAPEQVVGAVRRASQAAETPTARTYEQEMT
jgi:pimeloyl-ACP methyl ester carboxylesterase